MGKCILAGHPPEQSSGPKIAHGTFISTAVNQTIYFSGFQNTPVVVAVPSGQSNHRVIVRSVSVSSAVIWIEDGTYRYGVNWIAVGI